MEALRQDLSPILGAFARQPQQLLPALQRVQQALGWLPLWAVETVGEHVRVPKSEVFGVVGHYPELRQEPTGRHLVRVCTGLSCRVRGADSVLAALQRRWGRPDGESADQNDVTLELVPCAFLCSVAPVVEIGHRAHGELSPAEAIALVEALELAESPL